MTKGGARKDKPPSDYEEEEEGEQGEETIPKQGKASSFAEALANTQAELEAQSAIPSAGKESGKESVDSAKTQSDGALKAVLDTGHGSGCSCIHAGRVASIYCDSNRAGNA